MSKNNIIEVREKSTQDFDVIVKDEDGVVVTPIACKYTLTNRDGGVINELLDEPVTPAETMRITLAGDDLSLESQTTKREYRVLTVETDRGDLNEPENVEYVFWVKNLVAIT